MTEHELNKKTERQIRHRVIFGLMPWIVFLLIVGICLLKDCIARPDPIDDSINATREVVRHLEVCDNTRNGFRVVYVTSHAVTPMRLEEIRSREPLNAAFDSLQQTAAIYFGGNLLETDIYDFAAYALQFDVDNDVRMHNIFIFGKEKQDMYIRPNPKLKNSATWLNTSIGQGIQYINSEDIYFRRKKSERIYRYWKCSGNRSISRTDERFSHFSETERLW